MAYTRVMSDRESSRSSIMRLVPMAEQTDKPFGGLKRTTDNRTSVIPDVSKAFEGIGTLVAWQVGVVSPEDPKAPTYQSRSRPCRGLSLFRTGWKN
jgi:hypothetical protein